MLYAAKKYELALELYRKLRNCAHTHQDFVSKMYALHMMAMCFAKLEKYANAVICYKYLLAFAWTGKSRKTEIAVYERLSKMHLYLSNIEKAKFYDAKVFNGQYQSDQSQGYKVHVSNTIHEHPWLKKTASKEQRDRGELVGIRLLES